MKLFKITIIGIIGVAAILILMKFMKERQKEQQLETGDWIEQGGLLSEGEKIRQNLPLGDFPLEAYRDPELLAEYESRPTKIYYYSPESLTQDQQNLLFGTGTNPIMPRLEAAVQVPIDYGPASRYDYVSRWYRDKI